MTALVLLEAAIFQEQRGYMATDKPNFTAVEVNGLTGEIIERELTADEITELPKAPDALAG